MAKNDKLTTVINTVFYDFSYSQKQLIEKTFQKSKLSDQEKIEKTNKLCASISKSTMNSASLKDDKKYFSIAFSDYEDYKRTEKDQLIFKLENINGNYTISTGLYCGVINLGDKLPQIEIQTGYSDVFFTRILNYCCGIYADTSVSDSTETNESIYSLLVQYLFLISLRHVASKAIPKRYVYVSGRGYDVNGNIDIERYISHDMLSFDKKISYSYPERLEIQPIIDVLHVAFRCCKINRDDSKLPDLKSFEHYINELYSGVRPSRKTVNNVLREKCLNNSLYYDYKRPLQYAKLLLDNNDLNSGDSSSLAGVSGFLVDASFLWEMYLYNLMRLNLPEWDIESQHQISFYEEAFYSKNNYPDFVLREKATGRIFILDAKFKQMTFDERDVDNSDLQQLHSYSYYFFLTEKDNFCGAGLLYPSREFRKSDIKNVDSMFGVDDSGRKFGVFSLKDPSENETIIDNENKFICELKNFLS